MTPAEVIRAVGQNNGTILEKLATLMALVPEITTPGEYKPPRCACGVALAFWQGRHSGCAFILHPDAGKCPRAGFRAWAPTPQAAMHEYLAKAPDLGALDAPPPDADDEFEP